jgi:hypothetical protein
LYFTHVGQDIILENSPNIAKFRNIVIVSSIGQSLVDKVSHSQGLARNFLELGNNIIYNRFECFLFAFFHS